MSTKYSNEKYLTDPRSRKVDGWRASLDVFERHMLKGGDTWVIASAEHDIIWASLDVKDIPWESEDGQLLNALGWHVDSQTDTWAMFA
jgi:hypothetical protein